MRSPGAIACTLACLLVLSVGSAAGQAKELALKPVPPVPPPEPAGPQATSYYLYCMAQDDAMRRDFPSARDNLLEAVRLDPDSIELRLELATIHARLQELPEALEQARAASRLEPENVAPRRMVIELLAGRLSSDEPLTDSEFEQAVAAHLDLLALAPGDGPARVGLGRLYFERGLHRQSAEILRPLVTADPQAIEAAHLMAQALLRSGDASGARAVLEKAVVANQGIPELQLALAEAMQASGDLEGSLGLLEKLVAENPDRHSLRFELARMYQQAGRFEDGAREAQKLVRALGSAEKGSSREAALNASYLLLIEGLSQGGAMDRAIQATVEAERRFPEEPRYPLKRAEILFIEGRSDEAESILAAQRERRGGPGKQALSMVLLRAGAYQERKGKLEKAEAMLERSLEIDSGNDAALNYLGYMLADRGESLERALEMIEKAVLLDPANGAYQDSLGWVLFRLGRYDQALEPLQRAVEMIPEEGIVHDHLGDLHWVLEKPEAAIRAWEEALERGVDEPRKVLRKLEKARSEATDTP